jgi:Ser/Thr protein kinase RdoA (MazF antagonist)
VTDRTNGKCYLLRIHKPVTDNLLGIQHTQEGLRAELKLLAAFAQQTRSTVQTPVCTRAGETVTPLSADNEPVYCTVLNWIDGRNAMQEDFDDERNVRALGMQVAELHSFSLTYRPQNSLRRPEYGIERNIEMLKQIQYGQETGIISLSDFATVEEVFRLINGRLKGLSQGPDSWGLIHADLNMSNIIVTGHGFSFIDFCLSGYGYFLHDAAQCALNVNTFKRDMFLEGYTSKLPLSGYPLYHLEGFMLLAIFGYYSFHMKNAEKHPWIQARLPGLCETYCKPFIEGREIFYSL